MPFDGTAPEFAEGPSVRAVLMFDCLIEFFDGGRNWCKGRHLDRKGRRCLVQAMYEVRQRHRIKGDGARTYIIRALRESGSPYGVLIDFNDRCRGYGEMERILRRARELANAEPASPRAPHNSAPKTRCPSNASGGVEHSRVVLLNG